MSLVYALVARDGTILAEYTDSSGNFTTVRGEGGLTGTVDVFFCFCGR
jgi:hypothetical protein